MNLTKLMNRLVVPGLFALYMLTLFRVILFKYGSIDIDFLWHRLQKNLENPEYSMHRMQYGNFIPLKTISDTVLSPSSHEVINLVGNILAFMPYGIFLLLLSKSKTISLIGVFIQSLGMSILLECLQVFFSIGNFDVDDLILNTSGGLLGYCVFRLYGKYVGIKQL
ncbi:MULTISPECIES: VanZ family protein [unclassified Paenibacillus]|uniref:VanZ family protein n=1 Tax=unclassified Paenibacillus TaxID=185978 RepID=UPI00277FA77E|nr:MULTISPECIES: VanZ family protein [unclassified Paenibacillus]MDQ0897563.1 glycopeptide antibiotics resistance protein [Paenibacillus sp. V4I7]MDQ0916430.1 glycopeptide antibiotics resistance protein [Paenibacillus sp. V4I5]